MIISMNLLLSTYPRSGQHFFRNYIKQIIEVPHMPVKFEWSHDLLFKDFDSIITVIRDPKEAFASYITMTLHYEDVSPLRKSQPISFYVEAAKLEYMAFSSYALNKINYIYKYNDVINNIDDVIVNLIVKLNLDDKNYVEKTKQKSFLDTVINKKMIVCPEFPCSAIGKHDEVERNVILDLQNKPEERHVITSKDLKYYEDVINILNKENLSKIYDAYNKMIDKSISLS